MIEKWVGEADFSRVFTDILSIANDLIGDQTFYISFIDNERMKLLKTLVKSDIFVENGRIVQMQDTYCQMAYTSSRPVLVSNAKEHQQTKNLELTHSLNVGSYAGVPITLNDGSVFGTLCSINTSLNEYDDKTLQTLVKLSSFLSYAIDMERLLIHDVLTGLFNRTYWKRIMTSEWMNEGTHAFLMMDMDKFKQVNDEFGHEKGDLILMSAASIINDTIPEGAYGFRFSGDEFGVLFLNRSAEEALPYAEQIIRRSADYADPDVNGISLSAGLVDTTSTKADRLMKEADRLLYKSKRSGGSCVSIQQK